MDSAISATVCHLYVDDPGHAFERELEAEARRVAGELSSSGFEVHFAVRHAHGDEGKQRRQIEEDGHSEAPPDLLILIPIDQSSLHTLISDILGTRENTTCVFLHHTLSARFHTDRQSYGNRLFSVSADQAEIGRIQARQFGAILPEAKGDILYVQGRQDSYATSHRMKGLLQELPGMPGLRLNGLRIYGDWTPASVRPAVDAWAELGGDLKWIQAAGAQNDDMALALVELLRERGREVPVIGVDGLPAGKQAVDAGTLAATVVQPLGAGHALRLYRDLHSGGPEGGLIPEDGNVMVTAGSYPALETLAPR